MAPIEETISHIFSIIVLIVAIVGILYSLKCKNQKAVCNHCGHVWESGEYSKEELPSVCPKCESPNIKMS